MNNRALENYIHLYKENSVSLIKYWIKNENIHKIFNKHEIKSEIFIKEYGFDIIKYFIAFLIQYFLEPQQTGREQSYQSCLSPHFGKPENYKL